MTSFGSIFLSGLSGLRASQTALGVTSQNIANANTPGYVRTEVNFSPLHQFGGAGGVDVSSVRRAADRFLATASFVAEAGRGAAAARSDLLGRAQAAFGDPASSTSVFATLDEVWSAFAELGVDPSSSLRRDDAVNALQVMYSEIHRIGGSIQTLISEADQRIGEAVEQAQSLINRIAELNDEIQQSARAGAEPSAIENTQAALIDELSAILDVRVTTLAGGGVSVRTGGGALLVGVEPAVLSYTPNDGRFATHGVIALNPQLGTDANLEPLLLGGELYGLIQARDRDLPALAEALGGFAGALGDVLNEVHNENSATPAVDTLIGRQTGLLAGDGLGFEGRAIVGVVNADGDLAERLTIDFDAGTITSEAPGGVYNFSGTIGSFAQALNSALGAATPAGGADFTDGVLTLDVGAGGGLVVQQDAADPAQRSGRGFAHFFGLNDIVSRPTPLFFETGLSGADLHGLAAGGAITLQVRDAAGRYVSTPTITISGALAGAASTWNNLLAALNDPVTGVGNYGTFSFDEATGEVSFASANGSSVEFLNDSTARGQTGVSFSSLFGLSQVATAGRAVEVDVNAQVAADPERLAVGRPDLSAAIGARIIELGDNRGAAALAAARDRTHTFPAAGAMSAQTTSLATYSSRLAGEAGRLSYDAQRALDGAAAVATAAADRRAQVEGVSLDDELLKMTVYQNSYAAAARVIQAATEMYDVLVSLGRR